MTWTKNFRIQWDECGLFCGWSDEYPPFGCSSYDPPEPLEPSHICKKCFPAVKAHWIEAFKGGSRYGHWQKSEAERQAADECELIWIHAEGLGAYGTKDHVMYQYVTKKEHKRLSNLEKA